MLSYCICYIHVKLFNYDPTQFVGSEQFFYSYKATHNSTEVKEIVHLKYK